MSAERLAALEAWLAHHDHARPHTALGGRPPATAVVDNVGGKHT